LVVGEAGGSGLATASALLFGRVRVIDIILLSRQQKEKAMSHTQIQGPYDDYACKECTEELHREMYEQNIELPDFDVPYVEYPCPNVEGE